MNIAGKGFRVPASAAPVILGLLASILLFGNLGNQYLWQDEAQTALITKTVLAGGLPLGYDGTNHFSQDRGAEYGDNYLWKWHPWLPFYFLAGFFKLFGTSTFVARLPFVLFGVATVFLVYRLTMSLTGSIRSGFYAAFLLAVSVPFLLLSRQCRYYAPEMFFCVAALLCYVRAMETNGKLPYALYSLSLVLLFHTHQLFFFLCLAVTVLHAALFQRDRAKSLVRIAGAMVLFNASWLLWVYNVDYAKVHPGILTAGHLISFLGKYSILIYRHLIGPALLAGAALVVLLLGTRSIRFPSSWISFGRRWGLVGLFVVVGLIGVSAASYGLFFRNIAPLVPLFAIAAGGILGVLADWNRFLPIGIVAVHLILSPIPSYLYEITHDYDGPIEGIVTYLRANAAKNDIVAITYGDLPVKWYTGLRVVGGLTGEPLDPVRNARWVIFRKHSVSDKALAVKWDMAQYFDPGKFERIVIDYPDLPFENREEPDLHQYRTVRDEDRVVIYRRK